VEERAVAEAESHCLYLLLHFFATEQDSLYLPNHLYPAKQGVRCLGVHLIDYLLEQLPSVHYGSNNLGVEALLARKTQINLIIHCQGKQRLKMVLRAAGSRGDKTEQDLAKVEIIL
jgi:hypothetical protein